MNNTDRIFVTGASGFLGKYILRDLLDKGFQQITAHSRMNPDQAIKKWPDLKVNWVSGDLMDLGVLDNYVLSHDFIIHAAGKISYRASDRKELIKCNFLLTQQLVDAAIFHNIKGFVFISSTAALSRDIDKGPISESGIWQNMKDASDYSRSKWMAELEVWRAKEEGINVLILAPSVMLGQGRAEKGFNQIIQKIKQGHSYFPSGAGGFVDVRDVASFCTNAAIAGLWGEKYILNAANLTFREAYSKVASIMGIKVPSKPVPVFLTRILISLNALFQMGAGKKNGLLTHEALKLAGSRFEYNNQKSVDSGLIKYRSIDESFEWAVDNSRESVKV
ncbi:MAG: NAD-dependent epimerase/dehydratase family protein [Saprospiraceae bacterium]|nr:NAD-dependent epimerase/dehydratase family protein [Saprospiraceae bacterium]